MIRILSILITDDIPFILEGMRSKLEYGNKYFTVRIFGHASILHQRHEK